MTLLKNHPGTLLFLLFVNLSAGRLTAQPPLRMIDRFPELVRTEGASRGPLFTVRINSSLISSSEFVPDSGESFFHPYLSVRAGIEESPAAAGYRCRFIRIMNDSPDTLEVEDLIPLGASPDRPYIAAYGPPGLARATLFRPGHGPVGLIVPDNAWELGFTTLDCPPDSGIALLARRDQWEQARRRRYSTLLFPGGEVRYRLYTESYRGNWKDGWMHVFRDRWL